MVAQALEGFTGLVRKERVARTLDLAADATVRLAPPRGGLVLCAGSGSLLVTQAGDPQDHVLESGASLRVGGRGLVVAWALTPARLTVSAG